MKWFASRRQSLSNIPVAVADCKTTSMSAVRGRVPPSGQLTSRCLIVSAWTIVGLRACDYNGTFFLPPIDRSIDGLLDTVFLYERGCTRTRRTCRPGNPMTLRGIEPRVSAAASRRQRAQTVFASSKPEINDLPRRQRRRCIYETLQPQSLM